MLNLTRDDLQHIAPRPKTPKKAAVWDNYVEALTSPEGAALFERYGVNSPLRLQHALAQWAGAETGGFTVLHESGAYTAAGILRVFGAPHHSSPVSPQEAAEIAALPVYDDGSGPRADRLFERVYGYLTHIGPQLGNTLPGDGSQFRGLGLNEATGKYAYMHAAAKIGCTVDELVQPINLLHVALIEWQEKNCNHYADLDDCISIRKLINCGTVNASLSKVNGLPEAQRTLKLCKNVITQADFVDVVGLADIPAGIGHNGGPVYDVPSDADHMTPANEDQADNLWQSREIHAASGQIVGGTGFSMHSGVMAFTATMQEGRFSFMSFVVHLLQDPEFVGGLLIVAFGVVQFVWRRKRYYIHGV